MYIFDAEYVVLFIERLVLNREVRCRLTDRHTRQTIEMLAAQVRRGVITALLLAFLSSVTGDEGISAFIIPYTVLHSVVILVEVTGISVMHS